MDIGERIKQVRIHRGMTQQELADGVGVKKAIVSLYESNQRKPSFEALEAVGIDNPMVEIAGGKTRHKYTPHTCRHTFATLLKRVSGSDKDKQELIGHASSEMLRYYQDVDLKDLKKITDAI